MWLAALSALVLVPVALSGLVLGVSTMSEQSRVRVTTPGWEHVTLGELLPRIEGRYAELTSLSVSREGAVTLRAFGDDGAERQELLDPTTGQGLGAPIEEGALTTWARSLHRSLFLHETGRMIVGGATLLLLFSLLTGLVLLYRQAGWRGLLYRTPATSRWGWWHSVLGRVLLVPLLASSLTGTFLFMKRMGLLPQGQEEILVHATLPSDAPSADTSAADRASIALVRLAEVRQLDFPLWLGDETDFYVLQLHDRKLLIDPASGHVVSEVRYSQAALMASSMLDWHTGRMSWLWAGVLVVGTGGLIFFILSGFVMLYQRRRRTCGRPSSVSEGSSEGVAELVLLYGSEHGTTQRLAEQVAQQWREDGHRVRLAPLNSYATLPGCRYLVVFTCTYGDGVAPSQADQFEALLHQHAQVGEIAYSVVAFGSNRFSAYCAYGLHVDQWLERTPGFVRLLPVCTVDNRSTASLVEWARTWSRATGVSLSTNEVDYKLRR